MTHHPGLDIKHPKQRGEWAEMCFMIRAAEHGLVVTKPWGESSHYDFIVDSDACCQRVQVKSSISKLKNVYRCMLRSNRVYYTKDDFDFVAAYLIPLDLWYIIPAEIAITGRRAIYLTPNYPKSIYQPYREAWHLLNEKRCARNPSAADLCFRHGCQARLTQPHTDSSP